MVYVCFDKDIECGDRPANWCERCPKRASSPVQDGWRTSADGLTRTRVAPDAAPSGWPTECVTVRFPFFQIKEPLMAETPMQGLAEWLRDVAGSPATSTPHGERLIRWASEVEAARASPADTRSERERFKAWVLQRQRSRGYGSQLTDAQMLASLDSGGMLEFGWDVWQASGRASLPAPTAVTNELPQFRTTIVPVANAAPPPDDGYAQFQRERIQAAREYDSAESKPSLRARPAEPTPSASQETAMDSKPAAWMSREDFERLQADRWGIATATAYEQKSAAIPLFAAPPSDAAMAAESDTALLRQCLEALEDVSEILEMLLAVGMTPPGAGSPAAKARAAIDAARQALEKP